MNIDLEKYNDRGQFKVPEGYFDTLADRIMANIPEAPKQEKQKKSAKIIPLNTRLKIAVILKHTARNMSMTTSTMLWLMTLTYTNIFQKTKITTHLI